MTFRPVRSSEEISTELLYLGDQELLTADATIIDVHEKDGVCVVVVNRTPMYVKKGGQPSDSGLIVGGRFSVAVRSVTVNDYGQVEHAGVLSGRKPDVGEAVSITVDSRVRHLHSLWHSAGEAVIVAAKMAGFDAPVSGAIHYGQNQNRIEYQVRLEKAAADQLRVDIGENLKKLVHDDVAITTIDLTDKQDIIRHCGFWPEYLALTETVRVIHVHPDYTGRPCSGTHLARTSELGRVEISKIKIKGDKTIISYECL
jgi:misacylated tRNA(Ala) deacylase